MVFCFLTRHNHEQKKKSVKPISYKKTTIMSSSCCSPRLIRWWNSICISLVNFLLVDGATAASSSSAASSEDSGSAAHAAAAPVSPTESTSKSANVSTTIDASVVSESQSNQSEIDRDHHDAELWRRLCATHPIPFDEVIYENTAADDDNATRALASSPVKISAPPAKYYLGFGLNYVGTSNALQGCINDTLTMKSLLTDATLPFKYNYTTLMNDQTPTKPTRANMELAISQLISRMKDGDSALIHYSGHGSQQRDNNGDEADHLDETLVPLDFQTRGMISDDQLYTMVVGGLVALRKPNCRVKIVLDCCHSGTNFDLRYSSTASPTGVVSTQMLRSTGKIANVISFNGCRDDQFCTDLGGGPLPQGAFTASLAQVIRSAKGSLTWRALVQQTTSLTRQYNQLPHLSCEIPLNLDAMIDL
jgi:hypothetical protein